MVNPNAAKLLMMEMTLLRSSIKATITNDPHLKVLFSEIKRFEYFVFTHNYINLKNGGEMILFLIPSETREIQNFAMLARH